MKNFCKKYKSIISIGIFVLFILPIFYFISFFLLKNIQAKADKIQEEIINNNLEKQKIEKIPEMEKINAEFEEEKDAVSTIMNSDAKVEFIEYIEKLAEDIGVKIKIEMVDSEKKETVKTKKSKKTNEEMEMTIEEKLVYRDYFSVRIDLVGDYEKFFNFLHKLENNQKYFNIIALTMKKDYEEDVSAEDNMSLKAGNIFQVPRDFDQKYLVKEKKFILKSSLVVIVYIE